MYCFLMGYFTNIPNVVLETSDQINPMSLHYASIVCHIFDVGLIVPTVMQLCSYITGFETNTTVAKDRAMFFVNCQEAIHYQ